MLGGAALPLQRKREQQRVRRTEAWQKCKAEVRARPLRHTPCTISSAGALGVAHFFWLRLPLPRAPSPSPSSAAKACALLVCDVEAMVSSPSILAVSAPSALLPCRSANARSLARSVPGAWIPLAGASRNSCWWLRPYMERVTTIVPDRNSQAA